MGTAGDAGPDAAVTVFLCGDVMLGRGVDQILPNPCDPELRERYVGSALDYVALAERAHGPIPRAVGPTYIWGASLEELDRVRPAARIVNLETSITRSNDFAPKGINYRVSPENAACLAAARIDCCAVANNHILDFGPQGLADTLSALKGLNIAPVGAGTDSSEAGAPAIIDVGNSRRLIVLACCAASSGVPASWAAQRSRPGVNFSSLSDADADAIIDRAARIRRAGDIVVLSVHWGANFGYEVSAEQRRFARRLIDGGVDIVHGHSSHHAKAIELYRNRPILYGCGDFLNDYEGIGGHEQFRGDLSPMYFVVLAHEGLVALDMVPLQVRRFQLVHASQDDCALLQYRLDRESRQFGTRVDHAAGGRLICRTA